MSILQTQDQQTQRGFTLVELAIVLVIIGLLLGGILKGQELIAATRVNSTVAQVKAIDAAAYTFQDTYGGLPGDLASAITRVPNCTVANGCGPDATGSAGDADNVIDASILTAFGAATGAVHEGQTFFVQLGKADLIGGINSTGLTLSLGDNVLAATLGGTAHFRIGNEGTTDPGMGGTMDNNAHYLSIAGGTIGAAVTTTATNGSLATGGGILPKQANAIDLKVDDGNPTLGSMRAVGEAGSTATSCHSTDTAGATAVYNSGTSTRTCGVAIRVIQ